MNKSRLCGDSAAARSEIAGRQRRDDVAVIGPTPPLVTGRTVVTKRLVDELIRANVAHSLTDTAVSGSGSALRCKLWRVASLSLYALPVIRQTRRASTAYITVDASPGTVFTVLYALIARLNRARIVLHHHSYSYVARPTLAMRCLARIAGQRALHITPCAEMSAELTARYRRIERTAVLSNAFAIDPGLSKAHRPADRPRLVLGHLSNLTVAKGTLTVIECFAELYRRGQPVELHIAGPIQEGAVARAIRSAAGRFGQALRHYGPVDETAKRAFFASIDVFLFPTTFRNEAQPLVVLEALAAGVPVIATARACIPRLFQGGGGLVVPGGEDFKAAAAGRILAWHQDRKELQAAAAAARMRFAELREKSQGQLAQLLNGITAAPLKPVLFVGPVPPPVTGRTIVTGYIYDRLRKESVPLILADIAPACSALFRRARRLSRLAAVFPKIAEARLKGASCAYIVVDGGLGMYHTILGVAFARLLGFTLFLHHHVYSYIRTHKHPMLLLAWAAGPNTHHVVLSHRMARELRRRYSRVRNTVVLSNFCVVEATHRASGHASPPQLLRIGHLSNLSMEKGLGRVKETAQGLAAKGVRHEIVLAGPAATREARQTIDTWPQSTCSRLRYMGPLYGSRKREFFEAIDVFLFPSLYDNEAAPLVCIEALAAGVPVIAYDVGCVRDVIGDGGAVVAPDSDFAGQASDVLADWWSAARSLPKMLPAQIHEAYLRGLKESELQLKCFVSLIARPTVPDAGDSRVP